MDVQKLDHLAQIYVFSHFLHESLISDKQKLFKVVALFNFFLLPVGVWITLGVFVAQLNFVYLIFYLKQAFDCEKPQVFHLFVR